MAKEKAIEDMTAEEKKEWLRQYIEDAPKRIVAYDRFARCAVLSMGAAILVVPVAFVIGMLISKFTN